MSYPGSDSPFELGFYSPATRDLECVTKQLRIINEVADEANHLIGQLPSRVRSRMMTPTYGGWWRLIFHLCWHFPRPFLNAKRLRLMKDARGVESISDENFVHFFGSNRIDVCPGIIFSQIEHEICSTSETAIDAIISLVEESEYQEQHAEERLQVNSVTRKSFTDLRSHCSKLANTPAVGDGAAIIKTASMFDTDAISAWSPFRFGGKNERFPLLTRCNGHVEYGYVFGPSTGLIWGIAERYGPKLPWGYRPGFPIMFDRWTSDDGGRSGTAIYGPVVHRDATNAFIGFVFFTLKNNRHPLINAHWCTDRGLVANGYATIQGSMFEAIATAIELAGLCDSADTTSSSSPKGMKPETKKKIQDKRGKWIYDECCKGVKHKAIVSKLKSVGQTRGWGIISTVQGIRDAANRFADKNGLVRPPSRQNL